MCKLFNKTILDSEKAFDGKNENRLRWLQSGANTAKPFLPLILL